MPGVRWLLTELSAVLILTVAAAASAEVFQHEVLAASDDWIVIRENIPASTADTTACKYPRLDPSEHVGVKVHFVRLPSVAKLGRLVPLEKPADSVMLYAPGRGGEGCTSRDEADRRWARIAARGKSAGMTLSSTVADPVVFGTAIPAKACALIDGNATQGTPCRRVFKHRLLAEAIEIAVSLTAIPEAPDKRHCQFIGHRFGAAIQVAGRDLGTMESGVAAGGFATHYDCRSQQFDPLRLYVLGRLAVLIGGFRGTNIADRDEYPFLVMFPAQPAP